MNFSAATCTITRSGTDLEPKQKMSRNHHNYKIIAEGALQTGASCSYQCLDCVVFSLQNPQADHCRLQEVGTFCQESRRLNQWVPELVLQERWGFEHETISTNPGALRGQFIAYTGTRCWLTDVSTVLLIQFWKDSLDWTGRGCLTEDSQAVGVLFQRDCGGQTEHCGLWVQESMF